MLQAIRHQVAHYSNHTNKRKKNDDQIQFHPSGVSNGSFASSISTGAMGNVNTSGASSSCASGIESRKGDILRTVTSQEELQEYVRTQSLLELAETSEEASEVRSKGAPSQMDESNASLSSPSRRSRKLGWKGMRHKGHKVIDKVSHAFHAAGHAVGHRIKGFEEFMFPHTPQIGVSSHRRQPTLVVTPKVRGGVLLRGCHDDEEHRQLVREKIELLRPLKGEKGLKAIGLEYRLVPVDEDGEVILPDLVGVDSLDVEDNDHTGAGENLTAFNANSNSTMMTRLFHVESSTVVTQKNRKEFIADGDMYDAVARICQEHAQEVMMREGNLEWVTVCEAGNYSEPIRALVSKDISADEASLDRKPTLLIATGKGKVRAGVFSRQHLIVSGMECSTAVPIVREARKRKMNVVMLDPNVHGDRLGMITFEKSMARLFRRWEDEDGETCSPDEPPLAKRDLFVLSHSQSGAQFARYLLDKSQHYLPHIRAVAFTDSTHNVQWTRENQGLHELLQSDRSVYFRCSKENSEDSIHRPLSSVGEDIRTDSFWQHRFGQIRTRCAGTSEHSLTNWFARTHIWDHFDQFLANMSSSHAREVFPSA